jgi:hypothetical protein
MRAKSWSEQLQGTTHSGDRGMDGRTILQWILGNSVGRCRLDASGSGQGPVADCCEHDNEPSCSIKGGDFFD